MPLLLFPFLGTQLPRCHTHTHTHTNTHTQTGKMTTKITNNEGKKNTFEMRKCKNRGRGVRDMDGRQDKISYCDVPPDTLIDGWTDRLTVELTA